MKLVNILLKKSIINARIALFYFLFKVNFKEYWNSTDLDKYRTTEDYCFATWEACKKEVLKLIEEEMDNDWSLVGVTERIRKEL